MDRFNNRNDSNLNNHHCKGWNILRNLFRATMLFKHPSVRSCQDLEEVIADIKALPTPETVICKRNSFERALEILKREQRFFQCIERGSKADLEEIEQIIQNDPLQFIRSIDSPQHLLNKRNYLDQTPLYVACRNGHLEIAKLLIESGADFLMKSKLDKEQETPLEVAVRWGYKDLSIQLLSLNWPLKLLRKISRSKINSEIKDFTKMVYKIRHSAEKSLCGCMF